MTTNKDFFCAKCPKCRAHKHEELNQFGQYGNNEHKVKDENWYCEKHFNELDKEYSELAGETEPNPDPKTPDNLQDLHQDDDNDEKVVETPPPLTFLQQLALDKPLD